MIKKNIAFKGLASDQLTLEQLINCSIKSINVSADIH